MAYQSRHTGWEIDEAVDKVKEIFRYFPIEITSGGPNDWGASDDSGRGNYMFQKTQLPYPGMFAFFVDTEGDMYYCDCKIQQSESTYTLTIYSNVKKEGTVHILAFEAPSVSST